jgi:hypothetical protein
MFSGDTYPVAVRRTRRVEHFLSRSIRGFEILATKEQQDAALTRRILNKTTVEARASARSTKGKE